MTAELTTFTTDLSTDPEPLIHLWFLTLISFGPHLTHPQKTHLPAWISSRSNSAHSSSWNFFFSPSKSCPVHELGMTWWLKKCKSYFCREPKRGCQSTSQPGQGEQVIRLNPLLGSVSFPTRLAIEQSILRALIHHLGAPGRDG